MYGRVTVWFDGLFKSYCTFAFLLMMIILRKFAVCKVVVASFSTESSVVDGAPVGVFFL
jgi:hypothetical protein